MSIKTNIEINDLAVAVAVQTWEREPGLTIRYQIQHSFMKLTTAQAIFRKVISEKIPQAKSIIDQLGSKHYFQNMHLPLHLKMVFFVFIDELVEHYQNQLEHRDDKLDQEYNNLKYLLSKNLTQIWPKDKHEIHDFLNLLRNKLILVNAVPPDFDKMIALWSEVLNIQYVANMTLMGINLPKGYAAHRFPTQTMLSKEGYRTEDISYGQSLQAISLISRQISKDIAWIIPIMLEKTTPSGNRQLEENFFLFIKGKEELKNSKNTTPSIRYLVENFVNELKSIVNQLYSLDFSNNDKLRSFSDRINDNLSTIFLDTDDFESLLIYLNKDASIEISAIEDGLMINCNSDPNLLQKISNYSECVKLKTNYIDLPFESLLMIMNGLIKANNNWREYRNIGTIPKLNSFEKPEDLSLEKLGKEKNQPISKKESKDTKQGNKPSNSNGNSRKQRNKTNNSNKNTSRKTSDSASTTSTTSWVAPPRLTTTGTASTTTTSTTITTTTTAITNTISTAPAAPRKIELLREKLVNLFHHNPSSSLRQVIWHLDHLMIIQNTLAKSALSRPEHLCLLSAVANFAQKTLEQTYRSWLKQEQAPFTTTHNLKTYHRQLDPSFTEYPPIVNELFLANHWHRYFYTQHKNWSSFTTFQVKIPPVLDKLFKIAEGESYSSEELKNTVEEIIENSCNHLETLLGQTDVSANGTIGQHEELEWVKQSFQENMFTEVRQTLEQFPSHFNARHPLSLNLKQALSSLKILEVSLQQMNKANDISEFSTWTVWSLLQMQESVESVLRCIEYCRKEKMGIQHELKTLAEELGIDTGPLAEYMQQLSYKVRYPVEIKNNSLSAQIIDDLEALEEFPELVQGFKLQNTPKMLWAQPSPEVSQSKIIEKVNLLLGETKKFLKERAIPALQKAHKEYLLELASKASTNGPQSNSSSKNGAD